jgi:hypothetical protein
MMSNNISSYDLFNDNSLICYCIQHNYNNNPIPIDSFLSNGLNKVNENQLEILFSFQYHSQINQLINKQIFEYFKQVYKLAANKKPILSGETINFTINSFIGNEIYTGTYFMRVPVNYLPNILQHYINQSNKNEFILVGFLGSTAELELIKSQGISRLLAIIKQFSNLTTGIDKESQTVSNTTFYSENYPFPFYSQLTRDYSLIPKKSTETNNQSNNDLQIASTSINSNKSKSPKSKKEKLQNKLKAKLRAKQQTTNEKIINIDDNAQINEKEDDEGEEERAKTNETITSTHPLINSIRPSTMLDKIKSFYLSDCFCYVMNKKITLNINPSHIDYINKFLTTVDENKPFIFLCDWDYSCEYVYIFNKTLQIPKDSKQTLDNYVTNNNDSNSVPNKISGNFICFMPVLHGKDEGRYDYIFPFVCCVLLGFYDRLSGKLLAPNDPICTHPTSLTSFKSMIIR